MLLPRLTRSPEWPMWKSSVSSRLAFRRLEDMADCLGQTPNASSPSLLKPNNPSCPSETLRSFQDSTPEQWYGESLAHLDPSFYTQAANNLLGQVVQPNLQSQYASMGLGRSGAMGEALARAGAQLTLPIAQQQLQNLFSSESAAP